MAERIGKVRDTLGVVCGAIEQKDPGWQPAPELQLLLDTEAASAELLEKLTEALAEQTARLEDLALLETEPEPEPEPEAGTVRLRLARSSSGFGLSIGTSPTTENAVCVIGLNEDSPAAHAGVEAGWVVTEVGGIAVGTKAQVVDALGSLGDQAEVEFSFRTLPDE